MKARVGFARGRINSQMPDTCRIYSFVGWSETPIGGSVPIYAGVPVEPTTPCQFVELSGEDLVAAQAIDERIIAALSVPVGTVANQDSRIVLFGKTWYVSHVWTPHGRSVTQRIGLRKENA